MQGRGALAGPAPAGRSGGSQRHSHALFLRVLGTVCAIKELALEQLNRDDGEDEHEELVDDEDVEDVLQGGHHAVEDSLRGEGEPPGPVSPRVCTGSRAGARLPPASPAEGVPRETSPC